jgi:hypothetical protein
VCVQGEVREQHDVTLLRGIDGYLRVPNKLLRLLKYSLLHPAGARVGVGYACQGGCVGQAGGVFAKGEEAWCWGDEGA